MPFLTGNASFLRFRVDGHAPDPFGQEYLDQLESYQAGRQRIAAADGIDTGWAAGDHIHDLDFALEKNVIDDALCFDLRVDTDKLPADRLKAYTAVEVQAFAKGNGSGLASRKQKREAREIARERLEQEAKDGRFKKHTLVPVLWDRKGGEVWFGSTSLAHLDRFTNLFDHTFALSLVPVTAGRIASGLLGGGHGHPEIGAPSAFVPGVTPDDFAWIPDAESRDFLGNEFLLWLWFLSEGETDTVKLGDGSEVTFMIARTLTLECPRGQTGYETISHEGPSRLPEAKRAIVSGKLPRVMGLTLVRHDSQYELKLHAEAFAVAGLKLPKPEEENPHARLVERVNALRHAVETVDLLYKSFLADRRGAGWAVTLKRMQTWLGRPERVAA